MAPFAARALLLFTLTAPAAASRDAAGVSDSSEECMSLLQTGNAVHLDNGAADCSCLNWKQAYQSSKTTCGVSNEYYFLTEEHALEDSAKLEHLNKYSGQEFCHNFFETLDNDYCVNVNIGKDHGQWCYVSTACAQGAKVPTASVSWKQCNAQDTRLREYTPEELSIFALDNDLELGLLHKLSYPVYKGHVWKDVEAFWGWGSESVSLMPASLRREMQEIADSGKPFSFDTAENQHPPHRIVVGMTVYSVDYSPTMDGDHPGTYCVLSCVSGCSQ